MTRLSASELLALWERGAQQSWVRRALTVLAAICPDIDGDTLARVPISKRDVLLLGLRETLFGSRFDCLTRCQRCAERLELSLSLDDVRMAFETKAREAESGHRLQSHGYEVAFRLFNSHDFVVNEHTASSDVGRELVKACVVDARHLDRPVQAGALPDEVIAAVAQGLVDADSEAGIQLAMTCPACGQQWKSTFDIVSYLWSEIDNWARGILAEVHSLASAYGWAEADILAMTASRRRVYLDLVGT